MNDKPHILVLCTGNSCRSQMAHGLLESYLSDAANIYSAGVEVHGVNENAIKFMQEIDIDISTHTSNHIDEYKDIIFDYVITVCDHAHERCPIIYNAVNRRHKNFPDPSKAKDSDEVIAESFRKTRDMIDIYVKEFVEELFDLYKAQ